MKRQAKVSGGPRVLAAGLATPTSAAANSADAFVGAQLLYGEGGIEPAMWGVSKAQFSLFLDQVRAAHALGHIANVPPSEGSGYPQERFDDPEVGPSIHQVCARVVKPATRACSPLPGVAWAMKMNLARGGLPCSLLFSHGWDEGVYAFAKRVLSAWPDDIEGAYICLLSHPQHFDIDGRLHPSASPYYRVLRADPTPRALILLPSPREPLLSRLWVLSEAFAACRERERGHLEAICVEGTALELLSGEGRAQLEKAEAEEADAALALQTARMEGLEMGATQLLSLDDQVKLEDKERRLDTRLGYAQEKLAKAKLQLLLAPSRDLVDLEGATCSVAQDRTALREQMRGRGDAICLHVAAIVRQSICGVCTRIGQPEETVDGPLGPLPLLERHVRLSVRDLSSGPKALHLARWLWSRPAVTALDLSACVSLAAEVPHLISDALAAGALPHLVSSNLDGAALPIAQLQGSAAAAGASALDFSHQKMSLASGLVIASLISTNTTLDALNVGHNPLRDEGVVAISKALRENGQCRLKTLELQSTRLGVQATKELAATLIATASLTKLDVSHNRICGTWQDTYGAHGRFDAAGLHALSEALPQSSLVVLLANANGLRDEGAAAVARALADPRCKLTTLGLEGNSIGVEGGLALAKALAGFNAADAEDDFPAPGAGRASPPPQIISRGFHVATLDESSSSPATRRGGGSAPSNLTSLDLSNNMLCGVMTLPTAEGPCKPAPYTSAALKAILRAVRRSDSLTHLSIANNRICGVWSDAYGDQQFGSWVVDGVELLSGVMRARPPSNRSGGETAAQRALNS